MSTYNPGFQYQIPLAVDLTGVGTLGTPETVHGTFTVPSDWDFFWENTLANFFDVVLTAADGVTKLKFSRAPGANHGTKTLTLEIEGWSAPSGDAVCLMWLHFGFAGASPDPAQATTTSDEKAVNVTLSTPAGWVMRYRQQRPGASQARQVLAKGSDETIFLWVKLPQLAQRQSKHNGNLGLEWIASVKPEVYTVAETPVLQSAMVDPALTRFMGASWLRIALTGGAHDTDYTAVIDVRTTQGQRLVPRYRLRVRDVQ